MTQTPGHQAAPSDSTAPLITVDVWTDVVCPW